MKRFENSTYLNLKECPWIEIPEQKRVLGLVGVRKSGKTLCGTVIAGLDERIKKRAIADTLKELFAEAWGVDLGDLYHNKEKEKYRENLQLFSKKIKQDKGLFVFAEGFFNSLEPEGLYVADDIRFLDELLLLIMFGGVAYKVYCPDHLRREFGWKYDPALDNDISEIELGTLSGDTFRICSGGGTIYNTVVGKQYLEDQLIPIIKAVFPESVPINKPFPDLEKMIAMEM